MRCHYTETKHKASLKIERIHSQLEALQASLAESRTGGSGIPIGSAVSSCMTTSSNYHDRHPKQNGNSTSIIRSKGTQASIWARSRT